MKFFSTFRLSNVLVYAVWILSVEHAAMQRWIDPCSHLGWTDDMVSEYGDPVTVQRLAGMISNSAKLALHQVDEMKDVYSQDRFHASFNEMVTLWDAYPNKPWLPQIPKEVGDKLSYDYLAKVKFGDVLKTTYTTLQIAALCLEQLLWEQKDGSDYQGYFWSMQNNLIIVLCEIREALVAEKIEIPKDVTRKLMGDDVRRATDLSFLAHRDWYIYRAVINTLEYIQHVYQFFENHALIVISG